METGVTGHQNGIPGKEVGRRSPKARKRSEMGPWGQRGPWRQMGLQGIAALGHRHESL